MEADCIPIDLARQDEMKVCRYCDQRDSIIFPSLGAIRRTIVNYKSDQYGGNGEFFVLHRKGSRGPHVRVYIYEHSFGIIQSRSDYLNSIIKEYPNITKFTTCEGCGLENLAINAFCNRCGGDIYDEIDFEYGPYGSMSYDI